MSEHSPDPPLDTSSEANPSNLELIAHVDGQATAGVINVLRACPDTAMESAGEAVAAAADWASRESGNAANGSGSQDVAFHVGGVLYGHENMSLYDTAMSSGACTRQGLGVVNVFAD